MEPKCDIRHLPRSYLKKVVDLYKTHQTIARTEPGIFNWRISRQFNTYWDPGGIILGCFDQEGNLIGFVAGKESYYEDPYQGIMVEPQRDDHGRPRIKMIFWHEHLIVVPDQRRNGIGTALMRSFLEKVNENVVRNICHERWLIGFYNTFGFTTIYGGKVPKNPNQMYWINEVER